MRRKVRIMISRQKRYRRRGGREESLRFRAQRCRVVGCRSGPRVDGVAVEHQGSGPVQKRPQLDEFARSTGTVAEMHIGKYANNVGRHGPGMKGASLQMSNDEAQSCGAHKYL